jgi:hypothetical protein
VGDGDESLWAFDAFNKVHFLDVQPRSATVPVGRIVIFTITDRMNGNTPVAGASFGGLVSDVNGEVIYVGTTPGTRRVKAERSDSLRSPAAVITVA